MRRALAVLLLGLLAFPVAAGAATWSAPQALSDADYESTIEDGPQIAFAPDGTALAAWTHCGFSEERQMCYPQPSSYRTRAPGSWWSAAKKLDASVEGALGVDRTGRVTLAGGRISDVFAPPEAVDVYGGVLTGERGALLGHEQILTPQDESFDAFALSYSGAAAAAWGGSGNAWLSLRSANGRFRRPIQIVKGHGASHGLAIAVNDRGDAVVTWADGKRVFARLAPRAGRLGKRIEVGRRTAADVHVQAVALDNTGRATVIWTRATSEGGELVAGGARRGRAEGRVKLDAWPAASGPPGFVQARAAAPGEAVIGWVSPNPAHAGQLRVALHTARADRVQDLGPSQELRGVTLEALPDGHAAVVRTEGDYRTGALYAAVRDPGGLFGPAERVSPEGVRAGDPHLGFNRVNRQPSVGFTVGTPPRAVVADRLP